MSSNLVIGFHAVEDLLQSDRTVSKVFINQNADKQKVGVLRKWCKLKEVPMQMVPSIKLNKMTRANHQGVIALISPIEYVPLEETVTRLFESGQTPKILIADGIQDIKNIGAIARSCLAFDIDLLVVGTKANAEIGDGAVKASAGALLRLPVARVKSLSECLDYLKSWGIIQIAASEKGTLSLIDIHHKEINAFALWMGNEDRGLSRERLAKMDLNVAIPMSGKIDSLNVSVASGVMLYELTQRKSAS